jgi:glucuronosyltransferase
VEASGEHGIVLFSLGSFMKGADMREEDRNTFVAAFSQLKQRVLWRWDGQPFSGVPANVKLMQWIPQQDVLGENR